MDRMDRMDRSMDRMDRSKETARRLALAAVLSLFAVAGCGDDGPAAPGEPDGVGEARLGAAGGSVETDDGNVLLAIPAGALESDTLITIHRVQLDDVPTLLLARRRVSAVYRVGPDGLRLGVPGEIQIFFDEDSVPAGVALEGLTIGKVNVAGLLEELPQRRLLDPESGLVLQGRRRGVGGQVSSFSPFAVWVDEPTGELQLDLDAPRGPGLETYGLRVDGGAEQAIEPFSTVLFSGLTTGPHAVLLVGVPAGCAVVGELTCPG